MYKRLLVLAFLSSIFILSLAAAAAAVTTDTLAGTIITAEGTDNFVDYDDIAGNAKARVYGPTLEATVLSIYGLSGPLAPADQPGSPSNATYYTYRIYNEGNTTDAYSLSSAIAYAGISGDAWSVKFIQDNGQDGGRGSEDTIEVTSLTITEDSDKWFFVRVIPSANAGSGAGGTVTITAETSGTQFGQYTGGNGNTYGGPRFVNDVTTTLLSTATMVLTRTTTVGVDGSYTQSSDLHYPIPGAAVIITMTYSNEGGASAESCIIIDRVPLGHQGGVVNGVLVGNAAGWTVSYTTEAAITSAQRGYGDTTGWVMLGTVEGGSPGWVKNSSPAFPLTATYIKWEKASIDQNEDTKKLTWGYIIR